MRSLTGGAGVEYAFEAIGVPAAATQAFSITRAGGTCVVVGMHPLGSQISVPGPDFLQEKKLIGCMYGSTSFREHMPKLVDLFLQGRLDLSNLVSRRMALGDVNEAFRAMKAGEVARSVLEVSAP